MPDLKALQECWGLSVYAVILSEDGTSSSLQLLLRMDSLKEDQKAVLFLSSQDLFIYEKLMNWQSCVECNCLISKTHTKQNVAQSGRISKTGPLVAKCTSSPDFT